MLQNVNRWFTFCFQNTRLMRVNTYVLWTLYSLLVITTKSVNNGNVLCGRKKGMFSMSVNRIALGKRISFYRLKFSMTQEKLADLTNCSREYIAYLENGVKTPSLPILVDQCSTYFCRCVTGWQSRLFSFFLWFRFTSPLIRLQRNWAGNYYPHGEGVKGHSCQPWNLTSIRIKITK